MNNKILPIVFAACAWAHGAEPNQPQEPAQPEVKLAELENVIVYHLQHAYRTVPTLTNLELIETHDDSARTTARLFGKACRFELVKHPNAGWVVRRQQCDNE